MWTSAGIVAVILVVIAGAYWVGLRMGKTKEQKDNAQDEAEERAHDAEIAAKPFVDSPFGGMRPKD